MLRFLHGYIPESWKGLVRHGMIDNTSGVKFHQVFDTPDPMRFNVLAKEGGELYEIVRECNRPFYLDRLQGGWSWLQYDFDFNLWKKYQEISGEWMLGMQMHEWASNMRNDWQRIMGGLKGNFVQDAEKIEQAVQGSFHTPGSIRTNVESAWVSEYAQWMPPQNAAEAREQYDELFTRRQNQYMNLLLPCDSYYMNVRQELRFGAKALMPEVGSQIALMRIQLALTRGMANAYDRKWGTYYEPWGGDRLTCCYYKRDFVNEWGIVDARTDCFVGGEEGFIPTGGSSRALQKRIYYYSLLSGAQFMSEEWGNSNTFYDWHDYELTPYGTIKRDFLRFAADHPDLGKPVTPVALVLPTEFEVFDLFYMTGSETYLNFPIEDAKLNARLARMRRVLHQLLGDGKKRLGNEGHCICNSDWGDVFDIIYADAPQATIAKYDVLVDLDGSLAARHPAAADRIISAGDEEALYRELDAKLRELLPLRAEGKISWILNRAEDGWVLGLFNNEGVKRGRAIGEVFMPEADTQAKIDAPFDRCEVLLGDESALRRAEDGTWRCDIGAGQLAILKFKA